MKRLKINKKEVGACPFFKKVMIRVILVNPGKRLSDYQKFFLLLNGSQLHNSFIFLLCYAATCLSKLKNNNHFQVKFFYVKIKKMFEKNWSNIIIVILHEKKIQNSPKPSFSNINIQGRIKGSSWWSIPVHFCAKDDLIFRI